VVDAYEPDYLFTVLTSSVHIKQTAEVLAGIAKNNKHTKLSVAGCQAFHLSKTKLNNVNCFCSLKEVLKFNP
jgi:hypothetical protein